MPGDISKRLKVYLELMETEVIGIPVLFFNGPFFPFFYFFKYRMKFKSIKGLR